MVRPAVMAWKRWPNNVNVTTFTEPGGPLGDSLGMVTTLSMRESGNSDV